MDRLRRAFSPPILRWLISLIAGLTIAGGISLLSWALLSDGPTRSPQIIELTIPAGTAARVQAGEAPPSIPKNLTFVKGDTLVLRNDDAVEHWMGPFQVPAGTTVWMPLQRATSQSFLCSFHPQGSIGLVVKGRSSPMSALWPTLAIGLPLGAALGGVWWVVSRLDSSAGGPSAA